MIGFGKRVSYAFRCFFSIVSSGEVPDDIAPEVFKTPPQVTAGREADLRQVGVTASPATPLSTATVTTDITNAAATKAAPVAESSDRAVQVLALLQRDGRLIDFFNEDITPYQDAQIGAAVRELHANCRQVLDHYLKLEPIIAGDEDQPVTVEDDFDPAAIKLIGNVVGKPPLRGLLRHRGWRVAKIDLPPLQAEGTGRAVIAPAEVEIT